MSILTQCESCKYTFVVPPIRRKDNGESFHLCPACRKKLAPEKEKPKLAYVYESKPKSALDIIFDDPDALEIIDPVR